MNYQKYHRTQIAEMAEWVPGFDMEGVSISEVDLAAGSPKFGDMIARNPVNHADRWLVAHAYFEANFYPVEANRDTSATGDPAMTDTLDIPAIYRAMGWHRCCDSHWVNPEGKHAVFPDPLTDWVAFGEVLEWAENHFAPTDDEDDRWYCILADAISLVDRMDFRSAVLAALGGRQ